MACFSSQSKALSLTEKSGTIFLAGMAGCGEAQGFREGKKAEHGPWWELHSPRGRRPTNLQSFGVHETGL